MINKNNTITLIADPKVLAIPIHDNRDPMIDLRHQTALRFGPSPEIPNNTDYTKMRKTVYDKLLAAQAMLPKGVVFCLYEAYRSLVLQQKLFDNRYAQVKSAHPNWDYESLFVETTKMVSPVINLDGSKNVPPHSTGGAVDVYLVDEETGKYLDMGIHPKDWMDDPEGDSLAQTDSQKISGMAQENRHMMSDVLLKVGFINYPTEYWHWSYGDRYWAYGSQQKEAIYGSHLEDGQII